MSEDEPQPYNNSHRALLQVFLARPSLTFEHAKPILASILSIQSGNEVSADEIAESDLTAYIAAINTAVSPLDFQIRNTIPQTTSSTESDSDANANGTSISTARVYALVNTTSDALTQLATTRTANEVAYIKRLLDAMFEEHNTRDAEVMALSSLKALHYNKPTHAQIREAAQVGGASTDLQSTQQANSSAAASMGLTKTEAERLVNGLVAEEWFEKSERGFLSLTPRALMELRGWLVETYNEEAPEGPDGEGAGVERIKICEACRELVTVGQRCRDLDCNCRMHDACVGRKFRAQHGRKECPRCKKSWEGKTFVGERATRDGGAARRRSGTAANVNGRRERSRRSTNSVENEDAEGQDDD